MISPDNKPDGVGGIDIEQMFYIFIPLLIIIIIILLLYIIHLKYNLKYNYVKKEESKQKE